MLKSISLVKCHPKFTIFDRHFHFHNYNHMKQLLLSVAFVFGFFTASSAQCATQFYDGFESGSFTPTWSIGSGIYNNSVPSGSAPVGNYHLSMESPGSNGFYQGLYTTFTPAQPAYMSWWMRSNTTTGANGYVIIGDANTPTDNGILFCYFNSGSVLRFYNSTGYNHPISANTWYHVECRNMNWTSRTMDIYLNNVLILSGWAFRSPTATTVDRIYLNSLVAATAEYDDFTIGNVPLLTTSTSASASCFGSSNGSATVTVTTGTAPYTYSWAPSGGTNAVESGLSAGTYTCTVTDANGCTNATTVVVTEPTGITASTMQTNILCNGGNNGDAMVMPSGGTPGYTYLWSSGGTAATESNLVAGTYTCTITDANGCTNQQTVTITEPTLLVTAAANNGNVCAGDTAMLVGTAMGGTMNYTYNWMPGNMSGSATSDVPATTTTYTLLVTDANGCTSTSTTTVTVNTLPVVTLGSDFSSCASAMLDAQNAGNTFLWNDGSTTQMISVTLSGPYYVIVTDANGCVGMDTVNVTINANPVVVGSAAMNFVCTGEPTVQLFESPAGGTWTGAGVFGSTFEPDTAGAGMHNLIYTYTDSLGCSGIDTVTINVDLCLTTNEIADAGTAVFPNPTNGLFEITFANTAKDAVIEITDAQGRIVFTSREPVVNEGSRKQIDLSAEANGIYLLRVVTTSGVVVHRIALQH